MPRALGRQPLHKLHSTHCTTLRALVEEHFLPSTQKLWPRHFQLEHTQSFCPPPQREGTARRNSEKSGSMPLDKSLVIKPALVRFKMI